MNTTTSTSSLLERLRATRLPERAASGSPSIGQAVIKEWERTGAVFVTASAGSLESAYYRAIGQLMNCIAPDRNGTPILYEGGPYLGCWLESTGTISAELLSRFAPSVATSTFELFADHMREDGLMPYKMTAEGPAYRQIQMVTPLARSVWNHYRMNGGDRSWLHKMYGAMSRFDEWLEQKRNTRGTGCVEAFCTFDTGHDLSPRFWHVPDTAHMEDAASFWPDSPVLPFLAPDLTANVYCQRRYLGLIAAELKLDQSTHAWPDKTKRTLDSLFAHCYDEADGFFYDVDRNGQFVRVQSDVLLRVLACEVGPRELFDASLKRYLLNTSKFWAKYPFTSIAMDDPRFDPSAAYNSWGGPSNFLSLVRAPHAFEHHRRHVELTWVMQPILSAMSRMKRFPQCFSPWTGEEGFTDTYSPAMLCLLDYVERLCGIMPTPEGELYFTGLLPYAMDHGHNPAGGATGYAREVEGTRFELLNTPNECMIYRDKAEHLRFPSGIRVATDRQGRLRSITGMSARTVQGTVSWEGRDYPFSASGNEVLEFTGDGFATIAGGGIVPPSYR